MFSEATFLKILIYGADDFTFQMNSEILKCTINSIIKSDRFSFPLFLSYFFSLTNYLVFNMFFVLILCIEFIVSGIFLM